MYNVRVACPTLAATIMNVTELFNQLARLTPAQRQEVARFIRFLQYEQARLPKTDALLPVEAERENEAASLSDIDRTKADLRRFYGL